MAEEANGGTRPTFSVVTPAYNVERYIEEYFSSLFNQTAGTSLFEIILVDDGSTDSTGAIARDWAKRYPDTIRVFAKPNGGLSSARNFGLEHARGKWVTFIDPDDFIDQAYFASVRNFIDNNPDDCAVLSCKVIICDDARKKFRDSHPLAYRFSGGDKIINALEVPTHFQLSVNSAFLRTDWILQFYLRFDEKTKPSFEDAKFVSEYLLARNNFKIAFIRSAKYYYRKRADHSSLLDTAWQKKEYFGDQPRFGVLAPLLRYHEELGAVPQFMQYAILYHLSWYFKKLCDHDEIIEFLSDQESSEFENLLSEIFQLIKLESIDSFDRKQFPERLRAGALWRYKAIARPPRSVSIQIIDQKRHLVRLSYTSFGEDRPQVSANGRPRGVAFHKSIDQMFNRQPLLSRKIAWVPLAPGESISVAIGGQPVEVVAGDQRALELSFEQIRTNLSGETVRVKPLRRLISWLADLPFVRRGYHGAWIFMDRDIQADDNAEHLYRWVVANAPERKRSYFVLRRKSHDWKRLRKEGFKLLPFGSLRHRLAMLNADWLISSQADLYVHDYLPTRKYGRPAPSFAFLDHGVIKDDLSPWLGRKPIDLFVVSGRGEFASVVNGKYEFTEREVVLSGLPRHDRLLSLQKQPELIVLMPSWRHNLVGKPKRRGNERKKSRAFAESHYKAAWQAVVGDRSLAEFATRHGFRIAFFPHTNMQIYLDQFDLPDSVIRLSHQDRSIQEIFSKSALLVTDYSSVAFEAALIRCPVLYYHYDGAEYFKSQSWKPGYFDYDRNGFGEVCLDHNSLTSLIREYIVRGCEMKPVYAARAEEFFEHRDGENSLRTYHAILERSQPFEAGTHASASTDASRLPEQGYLERYSIK